MSLKYSSAENIINSIFQITTCINSQKKFTSQREVNKNKQYVCSIICSIYYNNFIYFRKTELVQEHEKLLQQRATWTDLVARLHDYVLKVDNRQIDIFSLKTNQRMVAIIEQKNFNFKKRLGVITKAQVGRQIDRQIDICIDNIQMQCALYNAMCTVQY